MGVCSGCNRDNSLNVTSTQIIDCIESKLTRFINVIVIGHNMCGDLGLNHANQVPSLTPLHSLPNFDFTKDIIIYSSDMSTIYAINNKYCYSTGSNYKGQLCIGSTSLFNSSPTPIRFFYDNNMSIKQICSNCCSASIFWITDNNKIYANGCNDHQQLGIASYTFDNGENIFTPKEIKSFDHETFVIDIQSTSKASIALCGLSQAAMMIINYWARTLDHEPIFIPDDIVALLIQFHGYETNKLYITEYFTGCIGNPWYEVNGFSDINIIKIAAGSNHFLCLSKQGNVYRDMSRKNDPFMIEFVGTKIENIECGGEHNLAIDVDGNLYAWGDNQYGQCGISDKRYDKEVIIPSLVFMKDKHCVIEIDCGYDHSYCLTDDGLHFLFGGNEYNQCITYDGRQKVYNPFGVNSIIEKAIGHKEIKAIYLGYKNTKLVVKNSTM